MRAFLKVSDIRFSLCSYFATYILFLITVVRLNMDINSMQLDKVFITLARSLFVHRVCCGAPVKLSAAGRCLL